MTWWLRVRRLPLLAGVLAVYTLLLVLAGESTVSLPSALDSTPSVLVTVFLSVIPVIGLAACLESRLPGPETSSVRPVALHDAALSLATVVLVTVIGLVTSWSTHGADAPASAGRNVAFLTGLMLTVRFAATAPAVLATVLWPVCVTMFGFHTTPTPYHWTILPERSSAWWASLGAALAFAAGLAAQLRTAREP